MLLGKASASETAPPVDKLMQHVFMPKDLPPRPSTAFSSRVRALTHGAPSDPHTSAASLFTIQALPSSADTGYLDTSGRTSRRADFSRVKDTRGSALQRLSRASGLALPGGALMSTRDAAVLVGAAGAERAGGASARENYLSASARTTTRPASARNYFAGTARRVELSGKPLGGVNYSTYSLIGGEKR